MIRDCEKEVFEMQNCNLEENKGKIGVEVIIKSPKSITFKH